MRAHGDVHARIARQRHGDRRPRAARGPVRIDEVAHGAQVRSGSARNPEVNFKGTKRSNDTHQSYTDPDSRLATKSSKTAAIPAYMGHVLTENRNGLVVDSRLTRAGGNAEREAALQMLAELPGEQRKSVGADKAYDTADFVA